MQRLLNEKERKDRMSRKINLNMEKWKIKTKKDWCIAFLFAALIAYCLSYFYSMSMEDFLRQYSNPFLTNMNEPRSYGNWMFTVVVMCILVELVILLKKRSLKEKILVPLAGAALVILLFGGYLLNCNLIVSVMYEETPVSISWDKGDEEKSLLVDGQQLVEYCTTLQPVSKAENEKLTEEFMNAEGNWFMDAQSIWIHYPEKYGHNFVLLVRVYEEKIFVWKGYGNGQKPVITFFENNGLIELLK